MLKKYDLSSSGYYEYLKREPSRQDKRKETISRRIKEIHDESNQIYGSPKIAELLKKEGVKTSQKYVWCIMKENRWKAKYIKPYTVTTKSEDYSEKLQNLLNRHFNPTKPYGYCLYMDTR